MSREIVIFGNPEVFLDSLFLLIPVMSDFFTSGMYLTIMCTGGIILPYGRTIDQLVEEAAMRREQRKKRERLTKRDWILSAAKRVFSRKGYEATSMEDIARECGYGKASLYFYFGSKEEVFVDLVKRGMETQRNLIKETADNTLSAREKLRAIMSKYFAYVEENREFIKIAHSESQKLYSSALEKVRSLIVKEHREAISTIASIVREGISAGEFKNVEPSFAAVCFIGILRSVIFNWFIREEKTPLEKYVPGALRLFLEGIAK